MADYLKLLFSNAFLFFAGYGSMSDWTALDPAIVSFRQFPSFLSGPQQQQHQQSQQQQHNNGDMFMPHLNQQQQQQQLGGQGLFENKLKNLDFSNRNGGFGGGPHGINLQNSIINQQQQQQQNSPVQVNANVQGMLEYLKQFHLS